MSGGGSAEFDLVGHFNERRRDLLRQLGLGVARFGGRGVLAGGLGAALAAIIALPAAGDQTVDAQILQTASSLEIVMVTTYQVVLSLPFITDGNRVLASFAQQVGYHHDIHRQGFAAATVGMRASAQTRPNPKYAASLAAVRPNLRTAKDVITVAGMLEEVTAATYVVDLTMMTDARSKSLMAKVVAVEGQHLALLRVFGALIDGGMPQLLDDVSGSDLIAIPASVGGAGCPEAFAATVNASPPGEGALP